jgi:hypothetical protein
MTTVIIQKLLWLPLLATLCISARAGNVALATTDFVGAWKLHSFVFQKEDGSVVYPFGEDPKGIAIYDAKGYMSTQIMRAGIPKFRSKERTGDPTDQEMRIAYEGFIGYGGTYETDAAKNGLVVHIRLSSYPNWVGTDLKRSFEFAGADRFTLRARIPSMEGVPATLIQIWDRTN